MARGFNFVSFIWRWVFAAALVFGTYNPTQYSYVSWIFAEGTEFGPVTALVGLGLLICWIIFMRATFLSMGWLGIILDAAFFACVVWLFVDRGWLSLEAENSMIWVVLVILSLVLAVGMSWAYIRRGLSGQYSVDDVED